MCCPCSPFSIKSVPLSKCWLPQSDIFSRNQIQSWYFSPKLKGHLLSAAPCFNYQLEHVIHYFCHELTGYCLVFPSTTHVHTHTCIHTIWVYGTHTYSWLPFVFCSPLLSPLTDQPIFVKLFINILEITLLYFCSHKVHHWVWLYMFIISWFLVFSWPQEYSR